MSPVALVPLLVMLAALVSAEGLPERRRATPLPEPPAVEAAQPAQPPPVSQPAPPPPVSQPAPPPPVADAAPRPLPPPPVALPLPAAASRRLSFQEALLQADPSLVAAWLAQGADPAGPFADGSTPLIAAVLGGARPIVASLLDAGASANGRDGQGDTPLIVAARRARADLVELLLGRGADARLTNSRGESAAAAAAAAGAPEALRWLRAVEDEPTRAGLLSEAVAQGEVDRIATLLRLGAHPDTPAADGRTALMAAAEAGRLDVARELVVREADVNRKTREGATALMVMQRYSGTASPGAADVAALARLLVEAGADVNARDRYGHSVLMWAEEFGNRDVLAVLEGAGARR